MKTPMTFRLGIDIANYLRSRDNQAKTIESAVRRSYGFKSWMQAMEAKNASAKKKTGRISRNPKLRRDNKGRKGY